ncbi:hypothetical protein RHS01_10804 [Rhizoctonia solani]|uniref:Uncharacterized protein n=1 Tax=Rhizoctonia solani TaxID=456999 RepID=A0A8H7LZQ5_9AGAM|nr:hypothetical protein RHS01_10804 [Rhizoctonia solani]
MELCYFVWIDVMSSALLGTTPLLHYDTTIDASEKLRPKNLMEYFNGCPQEFISWFASISAMRSTAKQHNSHSPQIDCLPVESAIQEWGPVIDQTDLSRDAITRLAVIEGWRHALLIYLNMGVGGVTSMDPKVQSSVKQIIRLSHVVKGQKLYERHMFAPAILAGACAHLESQRQSILRILVFRPHDRIWILKMSDFVRVLQHLWLGAAKGGRPIIWNDYVRSRKASFHVDGY